MYNKYVELVESTLKGLEEKKIDVKEFPNPVTQAFADYFLTKGQKDGDPNDDVVKSKKATIPAVKLFPSQDAIYLGKSLGMAVGGVAGGDLGAIISSDNYILDGHHRWAATMLGAPTAKVIGLQVDLGIKELIPVLRATGDAFGNERRGEPKGGDVNIFKATQKDIEAMIHEGKNMHPKFYSVEKGEAWLADNGGIEEIMKRLKAIQQKSPPASAPPRKEMPVIDADKGEVEKVAMILKKGDIDVAFPYAND